MVKYGVENHGFPNGKKFYSCPIENTFPKIKSMAFLMRKSFYCRPIENTFSKIKNVVFLMRKSFFYRAINYAEKFENASRPVSRVLFFRQPSILVRCCQRHRATFSRRNEQPHGLCLSCFGWGLQGPATLPPQRWALTPPFHPYRNEFGGLFLLHYPWSRLHRPLAGTLLCEARTFLTPTSATVRPTHIIQIIINEFRSLVKP